MSGVTKEQIEAAREIDLLSYLQLNAPSELKRSAPGEYRMASHGSLVISNNRWYWNRAGFGGISALDYLVKVEGMDFVSAVEAVNGIRTAPSFRPLAVAIQHRSRIKDSSCRRVPDIQQSCCPTFRAEGFRLTTLINV